MNSRRFLTRTLIVTLGLATISIAEEPSENGDEISLEALGIPAVPPRMDPKTGFVVGGSNATALIESLTEMNGRPIADLERDMRPGASSEAGFLGPNERLLDVLAADNRYVVDRLGLNHRQLARHLHALPAIALRRLVNSRALEAEFPYQGRRFKVTLHPTRGFQDSPFLDGTRHGTNATVTNLDNGKSLDYALLVPYMIERYGFYEGRGTPYRVEPSQILAVLDFLKR